MGPEFRVMYIEDEAKSQKPRKQDASRSWKRQGNDFFLKPPEGIKVLLTPQF